MKLSDVKTDADWEEYMYRKSMETHEQLRREQGIGPDGYSLPDPSRGEVNDIEDIISFEGRYV